VLDSGHPYRTRVVVRRPASDRKFNGTVLVEWVNVTNGFDAENFWFFTWEHVLRAGYAWVGVSAQRVGVDRLKTWNPARYGALDVTRGGTITNDALSCDIFMQAAQALRHPQGIDMLGGLRAKPPRPVLIGTALLYAAGPLLMVFAAAVPGGLQIAGFLAGVGTAGTGFGVLIGTVSRATPEAKRSRTVGLVAAAGSLGTMVIAPVGRGLTRWAPACSACWARATARSTCWR
jgi:hypothetical protein